MGPGYMWFHLSLWTSIQPIGLDRVDLLQGPFFKCCHLVQPKKKTPVYASPLCNSFPLKCAGPLPSLSSRRPLKPLSPSHMMLGQEWRRAQEDSSHSPFLSKMSKDLTQPSCLGLTKEHSVIGLVSTLKALSPPLSLCWIFIHLCFLFKFYIQFLYFNILLVHLQCPSVREMSSF